MAKELLVDGCSEMFELVDGELYLKNRRLYSGELKVTFMYDPVDSYFIISPKDLNRHQIKYRSYDDPLINIRFAICFDKVDRKVSIRFGLMVLLYPVDLSDAECMVFFDQNISIKYYENVFDVDMMTTQEHFYYDMDVITRRHTINDIINHD